MKYNYILKRSWREDALFWLGYSLFWHLVFAPDPFSLYNIIFTACLTVVQILAVYLHLNVLLPQRWSGNWRIVPYGTAVFVLILASTSLLWIFLIVIFSALPYGDGLVQSLRYAFWDYWVGSLLGGMVMALAISGAIHIFGRRREQEKHEQALEHARMNSELQYLRGQLNPHFLFNALNGIYFLIPKDPPRAAEVLAGFSDLLRYQLYRSEETTVPLHEELEQLERFAELSLLRTETDFEYTFDQQVENVHQEIPPMLLLPLLENAFKHSPAKGGWIKAKLWVEEHQLCYSLANNCGPVRQLSPEEVAKAGGIGLENIERRLTLLYPQNHHFIIQKDEDRFRVELRIPLEEVYLLAYS